MSDELTGQPAGGARIRRREEMPALERGKGARSWLFLDREQGAEHFIAGSSTFQPGIEVPRHSHNVEEFVTVLEGAGECEIEGASYPVKPFDTTFIPAGLVHCFRNTGDTPLTILWIYGGTEVTRTFAGTGITVRHFSPEDRVGR
ncbi:MAG TPA: cupin domain-containing protein [Nitrolancea sp.]|nr:cupin domain-containing protein [Nitrolancea sp.]